MCGIAAAIGSVDDEVLAAVQRMHAAQRHRGPDDEGHWCDRPDGDRGGGVAMAHRRLAIIDLSHGAAQPMRDERRGNVLVYNGEIYNYRELRRELEAEGATFRTASDTEVLLEAYGAWGIDCLARLRGMFTIALWDPTRGAMLLARDRVGVKPLYWCRLDRPDGPLLLVASELRTLLASDLVERRLDPAGVAAHLWNGFVPGPGTIVRGARLLPAGTWAVVEPRGCHVDPAPFWKLPSAGPGTDDAGDLATAVRDAVAMRLVSDVPLGIFLSGGIDSSAVAALAAAAAPGSVRTFNVGFEETAYDESAHARRVAEAIGAAHVEVRLDEDRFASMLPDAVASLDQPTFDAINTYVVSRAVREAGLTVALAGTGGDELFGGYRSFAELPRAARWARRAAAVPDGLVRAAAAAVARARTGRPGAVPPQTRWGKLGDVLSTGGDYVALYQTFYGLFTRDFNEALQGAALRGATSRGLTGERARALTRLIEGEPTLHAVSLLELSSFVGERLLRDTDAASMAVSLEVRVPLLDHVVIERAAELALARRFRPLGRKQVLRDVGLGALDPALFERPKRGFELPLDRWCRATLREEIDATLRDPVLCAAAGLEPEPVARLWRAFEDGAPGLYWSRIWAVHILLRWCAAHGMAIG